MKRVKSAMRYIIIIIFLVFLGKDGISQANDKQEFSQKALDGGNEMNEAFKTADYDNFLDFFHPKIIQLAGGRGNLKEMFKNGIGPGAEIIDIKLKMPKELIVQDSIYQCSLPQKLTMKINGQKMYTLGSLIGISYDFGESWFYIGVSGNTLGKLQEQFPELSDDLKIRVQSKPILIN